MLPEQRPRDAARRDDSPRSARSTEPKGAAQNGGNVVNVTKKEIDTIQRAIVDAVEAAVRALLRQPPGLADAHKVIAARSAAQDAAAKALAGLTGAPKLVIILSS